LINTFPSQRFTINRCGGSLEQVFQDWPYLKQPSALLLHFKYLMDFDLLERFDEQFSNKCPDILGYANEAGSRKVQEFAASLISLSKGLDTEMPKLSGVLWLIPLLFEEDQVALFKSEEVIDFPCKHNKAKHSKFIYISSDD
jgi:hypothetical protein